PSSWAASTPSAGTPTAASHDPSLTARAATANASDIAADPVHPTIQRRCSPTGRSGVSGSWTGSDRSAAGGSDDSAVTDSTASRYTNICSFLQGVDRTVVLAGLLGLPALPGRPAALEEVGGNPLGGLGQLGVATAVTAAGRRRARLLGRLQVLERRWLHARLPVPVHLAHDLGQPGRVEALAQVDGDDVAVDVDGVDLAGGEELAGQRRRRGHTVGVGDR